jgi:hypothetical protein
LREKLGVNQVVGTAGSLTSSDLYFVLRIHIGRWGREAEIDAEDVREIRLGTGSENLIIDLEYEIAVVRRAPPKTRPTTTSIGQLELASPT